MEERGAASLPSRNDPDEGARAGRSGRRSAWLVALAVGVLATALYLPSLGNGLVWDDPIVLNRLLPYFDGIGDAFFPPADAPRLGEHFYRPLVTLSYMIDDRVARALWPDGEQLAGREVVFHATPVLAHGVASALLVACALLLGIGRRGSAPALAVAASAGVVFAVHPVHVESVASIVGRSDVLCAVFFLASVVSWQCWLSGRRPAWLLMSGAAALAAMLSKEVGFALVVVLPLLALPPHGGPVRPAPGAWRALVTPLAAAILALGLRVAALSPAGAPGEPASIRLSSILPALGWYAARTAWPVPLEAFVPAVPQGAVLAALGLAVAGAALALVAVSLRRRALGAVAFAAALFLATLAPALPLAVIRLAATPLAERYLYLPSAGAVLCAAFLVAGIGRRLPGRTTAPPGAVPIVFALAVSLLAVPATVSRQAVWRDELSFWTHAARRAPEAALAQASLGAALVRAGRLDEAEAHLLRGLPLAGRPEERAHAQAGLGSLYAKLGRWDEAVAAHRAALREAPRFSSAQSNLAQALLARYAAHPEPARKASLMAEAEQHLEAACQLDPRNAVHHYQLGMLRIEMGRAPDAREPLLQVIALAPRTAEAAAARRALAK